MRAPLFWGRRPGIASALLAPVASVYGRMAARRLAQPGGRASVPVICVGNPTLGGAGKTPLAVAIARVLLAGGQRPAFLTRGYGGSIKGPLRVDPSIHGADDVGDEPLLLARVAPTIVARDRLAGARLAEQAGADVIVMDDGFQNPTLKKDFSLLVVDSRRGIGNGRVFPAGPLRAPLWPQLALAQALVVMGDGSEANPVVALAKKRGLAILRARLEPDPASVLTLQGRKLLAFAGIGDPEKFFDTVREAGLAIEKKMAFPDHHVFSHRDEADIAAQAEHGSLVPVTTEKDWVRLKSPGLKSRTAVLPVHVVFEAQEQFAGLVAGAAGRPMPPDAHGA